MKKILACVLALTMVLGMSSMAMAADEAPYVAKKTTAAPVLTLDAVYDEAAKTITATANIPAEALVTNADWTVTYDKAVLEYDVSASEKAARAAQGVYGLAGDDLNIAYMNATGSFEAVKLAVMIFKVTDTSVADTTITLKTNALKVIDEDDMKGADPYLVTCVDAVAKVTINAAANVTTTAAPVVDDKTKSLIEEIKALLKGGTDVDLEGNESLKGLFEAFGNADIDEILDKISGGNLGGLDLSAIKGFLETIKGLLGGGGGDVATTAAPKPTAAKPATKSTTKAATTSGGKKGGIDDTGDAGIALAATVCLAAAAAFVMSRKKKED